MYLLRLNLRALCYLVIFLFTDLYVFVLICQYYVVLLERTNKDIIYYDDTDQSVYYLFKAISYRIRQKLYSYIFYYLWRVGFRTYMILHSCQVFFSLFISNVFCIYRLKTMLIRFYINNTNILDPVYLVV